VPSPWRQPVASGAVGVEDAASSAASDPASSTDLLSTTSLTPSTALSEYTYYIIGSAVQDAIFALLQNPFYRWFELVEVVGTMN
jgi:hypothetical protein